MKDENKKLIEDFYKALSHRGLSRKAANYHKDNLSFFVESYLEPSEGMMLEELDAETMEHFFTKWYPNRVNGSRTELSGFIPSFRKFYQFLFERGIIGKRTLEEIQGILSRKEHLLARICQKDSQDEDPSSKTTDSAFWIDPGLYFLVRNLDKPNPRIILDFQLFLDYISHHPIRLTKTTASFPRKHLHKMNQMFNEPEPLAQNAHQDQCRRLTLFYHLGRNLDLFLLGQSFHLMTTKKAELFLEMNADQQLTVLIDALWNRVRWTELQRSGVNGFANWAQEQRGGFAELLCRIPTDTPWHISGAHLQDHQTRMLAKYLTFYEVVENMIMFGLREMAILDYQFQPAKKPYLVQNNRGIKTISLTGFGKKVMRYLARKARNETGVESLIDLLEESFVFL